MGYPDMPRVHPYQADPGSGAGNCRCGWSEQSHRHPHIAARAYANPEQCVCRKPPTHEIHTGIGDFAAPAPLRGLDGVREAVRRSRGGDAPPQIRGYA
jgi:hypothetical protein